MFLLSRCETDSNIRKCFHVPILNSTKGYPYVSDSFIYPINSVSLVVCFTYFFRYSSNDSSWRFPKHSLPICLCPFARLRTTDIRLLKPKIEQINSQYLPIIVPSVIIVQTENFLNLLKRPLWILTSTFFPSEFWIWGVKERGDNCEHQNF